MTNTSTGIVAIGRNEGERLRRCLGSVLPQGERVVYVDSGSTDSSVQLAQSLGAEVVQLPRSLPFTAARARNAGVERLRALLPGLSFVQFIDGDCELHAEWIATGLQTLTSTPQVAIVCGRRRERHPAASVYNHLCDLEWDTPLGEAMSCGGDSLVRLRAFEQVGGFNPELVAGEEPDLCFRLRGLGWKILRLDAEMTLHDAAMHRFSQWWKRNVRSGLATAEALERRGVRRAPKVARKVVSNTLWALPVSWPLWPLLWCRVYSQRADPAWATFTVLGKLPHCQGQLKYWTQQLRGKRSTLIEYK